MSIPTIIDEIVKVSHLVGNVIPGAGLIGTGASIAKKLIELMDDLDEEATPEQQDAMQAARRVLSDAVKSKAAATSDRLRGQGAKK